MPDLQSDLAAEEPAEAPEHERGSMFVELSNAVVRIHKQFYGKGPTKARSHLSTDLLTVVLEGGYTRSEQTLHERGYDDEIVRMRLALQSAAVASPGSTRRRGLLRPLHLADDVHDRGRRLGG